MHVVVFDLDNTLIKKNISSEFFFYLFRQRKISLLKLIYPLFKFVSYRLGFISLKKMHRLIFENFLKNQDIRFLENNVAPFLKGKLKKLLNPKVHNYLKQHLVDNDSVVLMSSSPSFLVEPIAKMLKISNCFSTNYKVYKGKISGISCFLAGSLKEKALQKFLKTNKICFDKIIAFSDSIDDLELLKVCNEIYLIKPTKMLRKQLTQKTYQII